MRRAFRRRLCLACLLVPSIASAQPAPASRRVLDLPEHLWPDLRAEAAPEGLATLALSGAAFLATRPNDPAVQDDVLGRRPLGHAAVSDITWGGNGLVLVPLVAGFYAGGRVWDAGWAADFGEEGLEALALDAVQGEILKYSVERERPDGSDHFSFPSGHSGAAFSVATVAAGEGGWKAGLPAYAAAALVGYSRVELNKHFLSDVIFGAGMGVACGRAVLRAHRRMGRLAWSPWLGPGSAGLVAVF